MNPNPVSRAIKIFRSHGSLMRTHQAIQAGISPRTLYALRDDGTLVVLARGLYRLADAPPLEQPDFVRIASATPKAVICLISALSFHSLTTQVPHFLYVALPVDAERPRLAYPPLRLVWLSGKAYSAGIETHRIDGIPVRIYGREKTIADCFKFRNKIGADIAREALREGLRQGSRVDQLLEFARIDRVETIMRPAMEAML